MRSAPRIVVTVAAAASQPDPGLQERKNRLYGEALLRHGAEPVLLDATSPEEARRAAFGTMDGLLLSGGADIDPVRYGRRAEGSTGVEQDRDVLEAAAWGAATTRDLPVLGICRGLQAINVFSGGTLLQDVPGHRGAGYGQGAPITHPLRVTAGTRLARILFPTNPRGGVLQVNSYHHQAVRPADLASGLVPSGWSPSKAGDLVEALESRAARFVVAVQTHAERTESTPPAFDRLWRVFVDACRGALTDRR